MQSAIPNGFRVGDWRAYPLRNRLVGPAGEVQIEPKAMQLLERLAAAAGEVVEREQLLEDLWQGRAMTDEPLTRCIATLRRVLDDSAKDPKYIQTIPKRGYRLVQPVELLESATSEPPAALPAGGIRRKGVYSAAIVILLAAMAIGAYQLQVRDTASPQHISVKGPAASEPPVHSIAVLPFANLSPDPENEYLADGLAAELLNLLTSIPNLKIAARTSAFAFKDENIDVTEIARQLRVAYILSGSVRQSEGALRISAQLVDANDGYHVWSNSWESELRNIFDIQDEIAASVVRALRVELLDGAPTTTRADPEAYALYLQSGEAYQGEPVIGEDPPDRHHRALSLVTHAIAIDPDYAPAWARLAGIQFNQAQWTIGTDPTEAYARARASAERALSLDPDQTVAMRYMGAIDELWTWDTESAAKWYKRALQVDSADANTLRSIGHLYMTVGLTPPIFVQDVPDTDPLNTGHLINQALTDWREGKYDSARNQLESARAIAPDAVRLHSIEALFDYLDGNYEKSAQLADGVNPTTRACALYAMGRFEEAQALLEGIQKEDTLHAYSAAHVYACWADEDKAFALLERAYAEHDQRIRWLRHDLLMQSLNGDPRWDELLQKARISDEDAERVREIFEGTD